MKKMFSKRLGAYLIDIILVSLIFEGIVMILPKNSNITVLESQLTEINEQYLKEEIDTSVYFNRYSTIIKSMDKENVPQTILNIILILGYFVLLPYYWDGKTIGKKMFRLRITKEKEKLGLNELSLRSLIINGLGVSLVSVCLVYILPDMSYFIVTLICGFVQFLLVIISSFMIIYRHDEKGVQDLISGTQVVEG